MKVELVDDTSGSGSQDRLALSALTVHRRRRPGRSSSCEDNSVKGRLHAQSEGADPIQGAVRAYDP